MKSNILIRGVSAFFATFALAAAFSIGSSAAAKLTKSVDYDYYGAAFVTLNPTSDGTTIRYTTDGSKPTVSSEKYDGEIYVSKETVITAVEFDENGERVASVKTTIKPKCSPIEIDVDYKDGKSVVSLDCATTEAKIYYTLDGTKPDENSAIYTEPITVVKKTKIRAFASLDGFKNSATVSRIVRIEEAKKETVEEEKDDEKTNEKIRYKTTYLSERGYMYVSLSPLKASDTIYYTLDGSKPSKDSKKYSKRIKFTENAALRAREYNKKGELIATLTINVKMKCAPVEFDCIDIATGTKTITLSTITEGATIYYTIDGTAPNPDYSDIYSSPLTLGDKSTIKAIVVKNGWKDSSTKSETVSDIPLRLTDFNFGDPIYSETAVVLNTYRRSSGLNSLVLDEKLTEAANVRAKELSVYMEHTRPTGTGYLTAVEDCGVKTRFSAEFIASYYKTPSEFISAVLSDKSNYNRILGKGYDDNKVGVGYFERGKSRYWVLIIAQTVE